MELIQELLLTGALSLVLSFLVARLVSIVLAGDVELEPLLRSGKEKDGGMVVEERNFEGELRSSEFATKRRVEFVGEAVKVDEFGGGLDRENLEMVHGGKDVVKGCCESVEIFRDYPTLIKDGGLTEGVQVVGIEEKLVEEIPVKEEDVGEVNIVESDIRNTEKKEATAEISVLEETVIEERQEKTGVTEFDVEPVMSETVLPRHEQVEVVGCFNDKAHGTEGVKGDVKEALFSDDDDWEGIERSELEKLFGAAAAFVGSGNNDVRLSNFSGDVQMHLYGLHKIATEGPCHDPQPMALKLSARAKWNAWQRLGNMSPEVAMERYITLLSDIVPGWPGENPGGNSEFASTEPGVSGTKALDWSILPQCQPGSVNERKAEELDSFAEVGDVIAVGDPKYVNRDKQ